MHWPAIVVSLVAILTLLLPAAGGAGTDGLRALERLPLPAVEGAVTAAVEPLEPGVIISAPRGAARIARALRELAPSICRRVEERGGEVHLGCRTRRLVAAVVPLGRGLALELRELAGLPVQGEAGFPLLPYPTSAIGLSPCPGTTAAARGECLLAAQDRDAARQAFSQAEGEEARGLAALRLGDLALLAGDPRAAEALWRQVTGEPWRRVAAARACEISDCSASEGSDLLFQAGDLPGPVALDLAVHGARALAYRGGLVEAATRLRGQAAACQAAPLLCSRVLLSGLRAGGGTAEASLLLYVNAPDRDRCPLALDLARAAAARARESGAPAFAANLLAAVTPLVPGRELPDHLLVTAELYLAGADPIRAGVLAEYARLHAPRRLKSPRWVAVAAALKPGRPGRPTVPVRPSLPQAGAELAAAQAAVDRARALTRQESP